MIFIPSQDETVGIVATGGTFEKTYSPIVEDLVFSETSAILTILAKCGVEHFKCKLLRFVDSAYIDDAGRQDILEAAASLGVPRVVVVHGTSSMVETALYFRNANAGGVFIFTGAMVPFSWDNIEASFNLGGAIALARMVSSGIYIYMHGQIFHPESAKKVKELARIIRL